MARTEECETNSNGTTCRFNNVTQVDLRLSGSTGQTVEAIIRSPGERVMGTLSFQMENMVIECNTSFEAHVRSCRIETLASKGKTRNPELVLALITGAINCFLMKLFRNWRKEMGIRATVSAWTAHLFWQICVPPYRSCLFYRDYVIPTQKHGTSVYEAFKSPTWSYCVRIGITLDSPGNLAIREEVTLYNGRTFHWPKFNLSLTPYFYGQAPTPILSGLFIGGWNIAALVPDFSLDLQCNTEYDAISMQCQLALLSSGS